MEFLKKNYMKMIISAITLVGAILYLVLLIKFDAPSDTKYSNNLLFQHIAGLTFFTTTTAMMILSMFEVTKKYNKFVLCGIGALGIILVTVAIVNALGSDTTKSIKDAMKIPAYKDYATYTYLSSIVTLIMQLIVFGLLPLAHGIKKILKKAK